MNKYIFSFLNESKQEEYILPEDTTIRELVYNFAEYGHLVIGGYGRRDFISYMFESSKEEQIIIVSQNELEKSVKEIGLKPEVEYHISLTNYLNGLKFANGFRFKNGSLFSADGLDAEITIRKLLDLFRVYGHFNSYSEILFHNKFRNKSIFVKSEDLDLTLGEIGLIGSGIYEVTSGNKLTFSFASGSKEEYIVPDDVTIRELVEVFVEDGYFGPQGKYNVGYSFTPQGGQPITLKVKDQGALEQTISDFGFQSRTVYYAEEIAFY